MLRCQGLASVSLFTNVVFHVCGCFFSNIGAVGIHNVVCFVEKFLKFIAIVNVCRCNCIGSYDLAVRIRLDVLLITEMRFITLFRPMGICVFLSLFVSIFLPFLRNLAVFLSADFHHGHFFGEEHPQT